MIGLQDMLQVVMALKPLADIADAYDRNELDDEARRYWGSENENENSTAASEIILYEGRGGKTLLTLQHCINARLCLEALRQ